MTVPVNTNKPLIHLAPMEGVVDHRMRLFYTRIGGFDQCVTEFVRVTQNVNPAHIFDKFCPELKANGLTEHGVPVYIQLLGSDVKMMAENAARAVELGAVGVDINFGCPAKTVNRHGGGATLLQWPDTLFNITNAVRLAVPSNIPVTAKMRLGFEDMSLAMDNAIAISEAKVQRLTIHARTKAQSYKPPAYWSELAAIKQAISVPLMANGEIWSVEDYQRCVAESGCDDVMLGRGAIACPDLAMQIRASRGELTWKNYRWNDVQALLIEFFEYSVRTATAEVYAVSRIKQWLRQLAVKYPEASDLFAVAKKCRAVDEMRNALSKQPNLTH